MVKQLEKQLVGVVLPPSKRKKRRKYPKAKVNAVSTSATVGNIPQDTSGTVAGEAKPKVKRKYVRKHPGMYPTGDKDISHTADEWRRIFTLFK